MTSKLVFMYEDGTSHKLPPDLQKEWVLKAERASLEREIRQTKRRIARQLTRLAAITGFSILMFGISKWIWPDVSIYLFLLWTVGVLFEAIVLTGNFISARKKLRAWKRIMSDCG